MDAVTIIELDGMQDIPDRLREAASREYAALIREGYRPREIVYQRCGRMYRVAGEQRGRSGTRGCSRPIGEAD